MSKERFEGLYLAADFCRSWAQADGSPVELNSLREDPNLLSEIVRITKGTSKNFQYRINCDADPWSGTHYTLLEHVPRGMLTWNPDCVQLLGAEEELGRASLRKGVPYGKWNHERAANACLLDFFLDRPGVLDEPKDKWTYSKRYIFAGTKYRIPPENGYAGFDAYRAMQRDHYRWTDEYLNLEHHIQPTDILIILSE